MKILLLALALFLPALALAQTCDEKIAAAKANKKKGNYPLALRQYAAAAASCGTHKSDDIQKDILDIYERIERLKKEADAAKNAAQAALKKAETLIEYFGFRQDRAWAYKDGKFAVIDREGRRLTEFVFTDPQPFDEYGLALAQKDGFYYLVNKQGGLSEGYNYIFPTNNGWYKVREENRYTFLDQPRRQVPGLDWFDKINNFFEGLAWVKKDGKWGFVDKNGQIVAAPQFDEINNFFEGLAWVKKDGKWGFVDENGQVIVAPQFDEVYDFSKGIAWIKKDDKWGLIDKNGQIIITPQFDNVDYFSERLAGVKKNDKWGFIDESEQILIAPQFDYCLQSFKNGTATVSRFGEKFRINKKGEMIVEEEAPPLPAAKKERE